MNLYKNSEGYSDPTAGAALTKILREERIYRKNHKRNRTRMAPIKPEGRKQMEAVENLANAIIIQAAKDYRVALRRLKKNPKNKMARASVEEIESFFRSQYYRFLTNVDGEMLIRNLREG